MDAAQTLEKFEPSAAMSEGDLDQCRLGFGRPFDTPVEEATLHQTGRQPCVVLLQRPDDCALAPGHEVDWLSQ
jgi:hypothetical protein